MPGYLEGTVEPCLNHLKGLYKPCFELYFYFFPYGHAFDMQYLVVLRCMVAPRIYFHVIN